MGLQQSIGSLVVHAIRGLEDLLGDLTVRQAAQGVRVRSIQVHITVERRDYVIDATYELTSDAPQDRRFSVLDLRECQIDVERLSLNQRLLTGPSQSAERIRRRIIKLELTEAESWAGSVISARMRWPEAAARSETKSPPVVVLPYSIPMLLRSTCSRGDAVEARPVIRVHGVASCPKLTLAGVPLLAHSLSEGEPLLEGALVRTGSADNLPADHVIMTDALVAATSREQRARLAEILWTARAYLARIFDLPVNAVSVAKTHSDRVGKRLFPGSVCSNFTRDDLGLEPRIWAPSWLHVVAHVARIWWGGGCQIVGPRRGEFEAGICIAAALGWVRLVGGRRSYDEAIANLETQSRRGRFREFLNVAQGSVRYEPTLRVAKALHEQLERNDQSVLVVMQSLTREFWGKSVGQELVLRRFEAAGVTLPLGGAQR